MVRKLEQQAKHFKQKSVLDTLSYSDEIIGREIQSEALLRFLYGFRQGHVVPLISIYGRSGSGKSTIARFVCENLNDISFCFVNLRKAKTVFGAANLVMGELGTYRVENSKGISWALMRMYQAVVNKLKKDEKKFFVLVLDEFDALFYDKRGRPSDFIYDLLTIVESIKKVGLLMTVICISNNVLSSYSLDDRVKSRIGSSEVFFEPYSHDDVVKILRERAQKALSDKVSEPVLRYCAELSSQGHGDARRAIDLMREAAELASIKNESISKEHIDMASDLLQKERIEGILVTGSYHFRLACLALARVTYLTEKEWHATSVIFKQYNYIISQDVKPLTHRRISDLLVELVDTGLAVSETGSRGRLGYGTRYRLTAPPELVGPIIGGKIWESAVKNKKVHDQTVSSDAYKHYDKHDVRSIWEKSEFDKKWAEIVGPVT
jgi:archaeal cell division control protein 6